MSDVIVDKTIALKITSPFEVQQRLRDRARQRRLEANLTQQALADRANVSFGTLKHFEKTGDASIDVLVAIAFALGAEREFESLFPPQPYRTINDLIEKNKPRRRGRRK